MDTVYANAEHSVYKAENLVTILGHFIPIFGQDGRENCLLFFHSFILCSRLCGKIQCA